MKNILLILILAFLSSCNTTTSDSIQTIIDDIVDENSSSSNELPFNLEALDINDHHYGSFLSNGVSVIVNGDVDTLTLNIIVNDEESLLGTYNISGTENIVLMHDDIKAGRSSDFDFKLRLIADDHWYLSETFEYKLTVDSEDKQKTLYATPTFEPDLEDVNSYDVQMTHTWLDLDSIRQYGDEGNNNKGVYSAAVARFDSGIGGYFGPQVFGKESKDKVLFSFWDAGSDDAHAIPYDDGQVDGNCKRNCQDGACGGTYNGTKCTLNFEMSENTEYIVRMKQVSDNVGITTNNIYDDTITDMYYYEGALWEATFTDTSTNESYVIGKMIYTNTNTGIKSLKRFHEHIGKNPCTGFYIGSTGTVELLDIDTEMTSLKASIIGDESHTCESFNLSTDENQSIIFETGTGVSPHDGFSQTSASILF